MPSEGYYKKKIHKELRENHDCMVIPYAQSQYSLEGLPDTQIIQQGLHIWIEFKGRDTIVKPIQYIRVQELIRNGSHAFIVRFVDQHEWKIDEFYSVKFNKFAEGVALLLSTLKGLINDRRIKI